MRLVARTWIAAALFAACGILAAPAGEAEWKAEHDAGWNAYKEGRLDDAETRLRAAEKEARALGRMIPRLATTLDHLAWVLASEGKAVEAEPLAKSALAIREKAFGPEHPDVVLSLNTLASVYDLAAARRGTADLRPLPCDRRKGPRARAPKRCRRPRQPGGRRPRLGQDEEAEALYKRALAIREKTAGGKPIDLAATLHNLGTLYIEQEKYPEAEPLLKHRWRSESKPWGQDYRTSHQASRRSGGCMPARGNPPRRSRFSRGRCSL